MSEPSRVHFLDIDVYVTNNNIGGSDLKISTSVIPKEELSYEYGDLHDILLRIHKFAKTELELYSILKMKGK